MKRNVSEFTNLEEKMEEIQRFAVRVPVFPLARGRASFWEEQECTVEG